MSNFTFPFRIIRDSPAVAGEVQGNFDALLAWIRSNLVQVDDSVRMTAQLTLPGAPTNANHAANKAYVDSVLPVGVMVDYGGALPPAGWLLCDGQTYTETEYPALWAIIGRTYTDAGIAAGQFQVPDFRDRTAVGPTATLALGNKVGSKNVSAHSHTTPNHRHSIGHGHTASSVGETQEHVHGASVSDAGLGFDVVERRPAYDTTGIPFTDSNNRSQILTTNPIASAVGAHIHAIAVGIATAWRANPTHGHGVSIGGRSAQHTHGITVNPSADNSGDAAPSTNPFGDANDNRPPSLVANKIIKAV